MLDPAKSISRIRGWAGLGPDESKANEALQKGKEILRSNPDLQDKKKNLEAAKHFIEAAKKYPDSVLEEDALYLAGECYYFSEDYPSAVSAYQKLLIKYRHSKHVDTAVRRMFRIGQYWELAAERSVSNFNFTDKSLPQYDTFGFAKKVYETIFIHDPNGPVSDAALMALATAYLKRGRYQGDHNCNQAAMYYRQLREDYPLSPYLAKACENELYARTQAYMGPDYPGRTLEEAKKLAEITVRQFGGELDGEGKADIMEIRENILEKKAEQLWSRGQHYDLKKRYYGSARLMYEQLIAEYPQTKYAEWARKRLTVIAGLPDIPPILGLPINPFKAD
jgi:outer membrane protein assembly factor BamD (BamD/ComL family)